MLNFFSRAAVIIVCISIAFSTQAGEPENAATISAKLNSAEKDKRRDGLGDLIVSHEGLVGCIPALVKMAHQDDTELRVEALEKIGRFRHFALGTGPQLVDLLAHAEVDVRIAAATAILGVEEKSEPAAAALAAALQDKDHVRRKSAADELGWHPRGTKSAIPALLAATADEQMEVRAAVAEALGKIASPTATEVVAQLKKMLADPEPAVRGQAATALWILDEPAATLMPTLIKIVAEYKVEPKRDVTQDIWGHDAGIELIQKIGPEAEAAIPALIAALDSQQTGERMAAADALGGIGPAAKPAIERLSKSLRDTKAHTFAFAHHAWYVSDQAAIALGKSGPAARPVLLAALNDKEERVRCLAAGQLAVSPVDDTAVSALIKLLSDEELSVRACAAFHLGGMGPRARAAGPQLARMLNDPGKSSYFAGGIGAGYRSPAEHALAALQKLQPAAENVMPTIKELLRKDLRVDDSLQEYLRELGPAAKDVAPALEPILREPVTFMSAALVLTRIAPDHPRLLERLQDHFSRNSNEETFATAVGDLGAKARDALPALQKALKEEPYAQSRAIIAAAIVKIDPQDAAAIVALAEALQDSSTRSRFVIEPRQVWRRLGREGKVAKAKLLAGLTKVQTEPADGAYFRNEFEKENRLQSALLLSDIGTQQQEVITALIALCGCDVNSVRAEAADALGSIDRTGRSASTLAGLLAGQLTVSQSVGI